MIRSTNIPTIISDYFDKASPLLVKETWTSGAPVWHVLGTKIQPTRVYLNACRNKGVLIVAVEGRRGGRTTVADFGINEATRP